jgi:hypothetical protein
MNAAILFVLVQNEIRVRTRRLSTLICLLVVILLSWSVVADPAKGQAMIVVAKQAVAYDSQTLAIGTGIWASFIFGLAAFYLARGRTREDLTYGVGNVLAATPISNLSLVVARWLGAMIFLSTLILALMGTMIVLQAVRGVGPIQPLVFLQTYTLLLLPTLALAAGIAVLCDSVKMLMGKGGDVLYFLCWVGQFATMPMQLAKKTTDISFIAFADISGIGTIATRLRQLFDTEKVAIGGSKFDPNLPALVIQDFWSTEMIVARIAAACVAVIPLLIAAAVFHRYAPDKVKGAVSGRKSTGGLWGWINRIIRPVTAVVTPLYSLGARLPRILGQLLAEIALTLSANPVLLLAMFGVVVAGIVAPTEKLGTVLAVAIGCWGILIADISARDHQSGTELMTAAVPGGMTGRFWLQSGVSIWLALLYVAPVLLRWLDAAPKQALALVVGILMLSAAAMMFGRLTRSGRPFLGLFLFGLYLAVEVKPIRWFDVVGFNGRADAETMSTYFLVGTLMVAVGYFFTWRKSR